MKKSISDAGKDHPELGKGNIGYYVAALWALFIFFIYFKDKFLDIFLSSRLLKKLLQLME